MPRSFLIKKTDRRLSVHGFRHSSKTSCLLPVTIESVSGGRELSNDIPLAVRISTDYSASVISPPRYCSSPSVAANDRSISDVDSEPASPGYDESVHAAGDALVRGLRRSLSFQNGVTVGYTYDSFFVTDGRSRRTNTQDAVMRRPRYTCSECGKHYATSSNLSRHKQTHRSLDSNLARRCGQCGKAYVSMPALAMHVLTHELRHVCPVCGKAFSRPWLLQGHLRSHSGEKPYGCAHCGRAFADRSNLRAHMQTHSAAKHFRCERCSKTFALKSYLNKHYESACLRDRDDGHFPPKSSLGVYDVAVSDDDDTLMTSQWRLLEEGERSCEADDTVVNGRYDGPRESQPTMRESAVKPETDLSQATDVCVRR